MNKTITVYELLGLVKDGKAPKKIKYDTKEYVFRNYDYKETMDALIDEQSSLIECIDFYKFDEPVEIIEDNDKLEKIKLDEEHCRLYKNNEEWWAIKRHQLFVYKEINKMIDHINKIEEKINE